ncbi:unnamed protein product, partial [Prorocentrum cordatum]
DQGRGGEASDRHEGPEMLGKAFQASVFSIDRERELEEAAKAVEAPPERPRKAALEAARLEKPKAVEEPVRPLERNIHLTSALAGELTGDLAAAYSQRSFQESGCASARATPATSAPSSWPACRRPGLPGAEASAAEVGFRGQRARRPRDDRRPARPRRKRAGAAACSGRTAASSCCTAARTGKMLDALVR